jgi:hypothetical protein
VDRSTIDVSSGGNNWWQQLYNKSNFSFVGVYLTAGPISPNVKDDYSVASGNVGKHWTREFPNIQNQGWGFAFFYTGYSSGVEIVAQGWPTDDHKYVSPPASIENDIPLARERGVLHARHIKTIVRDFGPGSEGSVVYVDNEDHGIRLPWLWAYYDAMFEEMRTQGPGGLPAVRPGLYAASVAAAQAMPNNPDLFVWHVSVTNQTGNPWTQPANNIELDLTPFPMKAFRHNREREIMLTVGRQGRLNFNSKMPKPNLPNLPGQRPWDFDMSFVREPRYPVANPRIRFFGTFLMRGIFQKDPRGMVIREINNTNTQDIPAKILAEPEAPLFLTHRPELFTVNTNEALASSTRIDDRSWSQLTSLPTTPTDPPLRRIRAFNVIALGPSDLHLFYISVSHEIIARRRTGPVPGTIYPWSAPARMCPHLRAHPFSTLSCSSSPTSISVFFIDQAQVLQVATWSSTTSKTYPGSTSLALHQAPPAGTPPGLLLGTAMRTSMPSDRQQALFAISHSSLRLTVVIFTDGLNWGPLIPLGETNTDKIFAHSRLATFAQSAAVIRVAAISQNGDPCIFTLTLTGNTAVAAKAVLGHHAEATPAAWGTGAALETRLSAAGATAAARYFDINPFGDLALGMVGTSLTLTCVGTRPGRVAILQKKVDVIADWTVIM